MRINFDLKLIEYYNKFGWGKIGIDEFKSQPVTIMAVNL
jgi:hypothetical protein